MTPHDSDMEARMSTLEADHRLILKVLERIEPSVVKLDDRVRTVEVTLGRIEGQLNLLTGKIPSWWHQTASLAAMLTLLAVALGLARVFGILH